MTDYHEATISRMCAAGQVLRMQALRQARRIQNAAWLREGVTPVERSNMIEEARQASGDAYQDAWQAWQQHYNNCEVCRRAI